jgi:hypothetical protein
LPTEKQRFEFAYFFGISDCLFFSHSVIESSEYPTHRALMWIAGTKSPLALNLKMELRDMPKIFTN